MTTSDSWEEWYLPPGCPDPQTLSGSGVPGIVSKAEHTRVSWQLTRLPDANHDGVPDGGNGRTGTCGSQPPPPATTTTGTAGSGCGFSGEHGCPPPDPYRQGFDGDSMAGLCGRAHAGPAEGRPRCYVLLGQKTIMAVKDHEGQLAAFSSIVSGRIARAMAEQVLVAKAKSTLVSIALKKFASEGAARANSALGFGKLLAEVFVAGVYAQRWHDLGAPGFPPKCFGFQLTYDGGTSAKAAFDPIFSFVRTWDRTDPATYRGIATSNMHWWDEEKGHDYLLPLFCRGPGAQAVSTGSEPPGQLLDPPYVRFDVDFRH